MTWGDDLWDQGDNIANYTQEGIDFLLTYAKFAKERARIEAEYGNALRKVVKQFLSETSSKKKAGDELSTNAKAFNVLLLETEDIAKQHEGIGESLVSVVAEPLKNLAKDVTNERKKQLTESARLQSNLKKTLEDLDKIKKNYEKCCKESEAAKQAFEKADKDVNLTKAQVDKFKAAWQQKQKLAEDANSEYQIAIDKTNNFCHTHYHTELPAVYDALQKMEEERVAKLATLFTQYADVERSTLSIFTTCLNNITAEAAKVNPAKDSLLFIEDHKSGFAVPGDIQYQEYGSKTVAPPPAQMTRVGTTAKKKTGGLFGKKKKDEGMGEDFADLPPEKRKKRIAQKIGELEADLAKEQKKKDSLDNMIKLYTEKPQLADEKAMSEARSQLGETAKAMEALNKELYKFQCYLAAFESVSSPSPSGSPAPIKNTKSFPTTAAAAAVQDSFDDDFGSGSGKTCRALYDFEPSGEGELAITANEVLAVVENDGSGWVRVARGDDEGYVPETYIQVL